MPEASMTAARLAYQAPGGRGVILVDELESLLSAAGLAGGVPLLDERGHIVGTFTRAPVWDDATGTPAEDADDIRLAESAMREEGSVSLEELEAESSA